jgi:hypothetical protein
LREERREFRIEEGEDDRSEAAILYDGTAV